VRAPAKVNLYLRVGPRRDDGFHDLMTVFQAVSLYDEITVSEADRLGVEVTGEDAAVVPADESNLAARAVVALANRVGRAPNVHIAIRKGIPVAGGMAGGSADAAAALVGCDALWQAGAGTDVLHEVAVELGSDVPFCLVGGTALGAGRGERLTTVLGRGRYHWVFALADGGLSTPAVYRELDRMRTEQPAVEPALPDDLLSALRSGDPRRLAPMLHNDLQTAALRLRPALRRTLDAGHDAHAIGAIVSGSGPTCAFLVDDEEHAASVLARLSASGTCRTLRHAYGPVAGARVAG
jgi:4-diphosphocytidyl-2-C-methyl-D-erythritol kinase